MDKHLGHLAFLILIPLFLNSCLQNTKTGHNLEYLPLYSLKELEKNGRVMYVTITDTIILVQQESSIREKAEILAQFVSGRYFNNLKISILSIDTIEGETCLNIDLIENKKFDPSKTPSWYQYFQGTTGGSRTSNILISNFLQSQYKGEWIDEIRFYYQGGEIEEWDHIWLGKHKRYDFVSN
jgi:hypothetical protein